MNNYINLYIDDLRKVPDNFICARNYNKAINYLNNYNINILSLDHDLGEEKTGYDIVKYICMNNIKINSIYIHTDNVVGRENMYSTLIAAQKRSIIDSNIKIYSYPYCDNIY